MNQNKDILKKILRLGCVLQDSQSHTANETGVAAKQGSPALPCSQGKLWRSKLRRKRQASWCCDSTALACFSATPSSGRRIVIELSIRDAVPCWLTPFAINDFPTPSCCPKLAALLGLLIRSEEILVRTPRNTMKRFSFNNLQIRLDVSGLSLTLSGSRFHSRLFVFYTRPITENPKRSNLSTYYSISVT